MVYVYVPLCTSGEEGKTFNLTHQLNWPPSEMFQHNPEVVLGTNRCCCGAKLSAAQTHPPNTHLHAHLTRARGGGKERCRTLLS